MACQTIPTYFNQVFRTNYEGPWECERMVWSATKLPILEWTANPIKGGRCRKKHLQVVNIPFLPCLHLRNH
uniref:Uncharacterized protein n=1 Tax=Ascaris lumbricoides TaxID=6252 RepID=A0A0M3ID70_ASCLU